MHCILTRDRKRYIMSGESDNGQTQDMVFLAEDADIKDFPENLGRMVDYSSYLAAAPPIQL